MEPETEHIAPAPGPPTGSRPKERPGWTAIVLVLSFVLFGVALYVAGGLMVKRPAAGVISKLGLSERRHETGTSAPFSSVSVHIREPEFGITGPSANRLPPEATW